MHLARLARLAARTLAFGVALSGFALGCSAPVDDEPTATGADAMNVADLRVRIFHMQLKLQGERSCALAGCDQRLRVRLINPLRATWFESCSVVLPNETYPDNGLRPAFGSASSPLRPGAPMISDVAWIQVTLEEGDFATRRDPSRFASFTDDCGGPSRTVLDTGWLPYDQDRVATGSTPELYQGGEWLGAILEVHYRTDVLFDLGSGATTLSKTAPR